MWENNLSFKDWSWSAVFAGVVASLVFQVLLAIVGFGAGLLSFDVPTAENAPRAVSWAVFGWWAVFSLAGAALAGAFS